MLSFKKFHPLFASRNVFLRHQFYYTYEKEELHISDNFHILNVVQY